MAGEKKGIRLAGYGILTAILFFGLLRIFIYTTGKFFWLEMTGLIVLLVLAFIGFIGFPRRWGENLLFIVFFFYLVNLLLIWYFYGSIYLVLLILAMLGFLLGIPRKEIYPPETKEPHSMVFDKPVKKPEVKEAIPAAGLKEMRPKEAKEIKGTGAAAARFIPGKYVASQSSNVYHEPKCEWAQKIRKSRQVWFREKKEAWEKGYKGHSCVR